MAATSRNLVRSLQDFTLQGVQAQQDKLLGGGASTSVFELEYNGLKCAGRKIHEWLLKNQSSDKTERPPKFEEECNFLSLVRHPNIVQFLGVYFQKGVQAPILVMEFLPTNLTSCIEQYGILPKEISYSILHDVALGLCYLHSQTPCIIHRNLYSNNILLTPNMTAKISDLGKAKILEKIPAASGMTITPGNSSFMPPEAMVNNPKYDTCIDEFSYGVVMIHMFSGQWPEPQIARVTTESDGHKLTAVSEAKRREKFLQAIGDDHPLMDLIRKCIDNHPQSRAHASEIVGRLSEMVLRFPASFADRLEMLRQIQELQSQIVLLKETHEAELKKLKSTINNKDNVTHLTTETQKETDKTTGQNDHVEKEERTPASSTDLVDDSQGTAHYADDSQDNATGQSAAEVHEKEKGKSTGSTYPIDISQAFPGVEVCAMREVRITNDQQTFFWKDYGLMLRIQQGSLPAGMKQCTIAIVVSIAGLYQFPENSHLVSGVFWFRCEPSCKFMKPLSMEIQHCARPENISKLHFVKASCSQKSLPYTFQQQQGGRFTKCNGILELESFSGGAITQEGSEDREYIARLFYLNPTTSKCVIDMVVTWNLKAHLSVIEENYCQQEHVFSGPDLPVEFEADQIRLDIPNEGTVLKEGWKLTPLIPPVVTKRHLDKYEPGQRIPRCQLTAEFKSVSEAEPIPALEHHVKLIGAKEPYNMFTIKPESATESPQRLSRPFSRERDRSLMTQVSNTSSDSPGYSRQQTYSSSDDSEKPSLSDILRELLNKVAEEWEDIGILLRIDDGQLKQIKSDNDNKSKRCFREMSRVWLSSIDPPPSWSAMAEALVVLGYEDTASQIKSKYC